MNSATYNNGKNTYLVAGQESHCQLYNVRMSVGTEKRGSVSSADNTNEGKPAQRHKRKSLLLK